MSKRRIANKEAVEALLKRSIQPEDEEGEIVEKKKVIIKKKKIRKIPQFIIYFEIYDIATKKKIAQFDDFSECKVKPSQVKNEFKGQIDLVLNTKFEKNVAVPMNSIFDDHGWMSYVNKKNWIFFIFFNKRSKVFEIEEFFGTISKFIDKLSANQSDAEIKKNLKKILIQYFASIANKDSTSKKINRINDKLNIAKENIENTMKHVNVNIVNMEQTEKLAKEAYNEAKEMNDQAGELADMMNGGDWKTTAIMIFVGVLLCVAVFGNLYAQINNPPPPAPRRARLIQDFSSLKSKSFVEDKDLIAKYGILDKDIKMKKKEINGLKKFFSIEPYK